MNTNRFKSYCNKPYDLLASKKFLYPFAPGMGVFVFIFLWIFEPFGLENLADSEKFSVIGLYAGASLALSAFQFWAIQPLVFKKYKVCNTFLWLLLHLVLLGLCNGLINSFLWNDGYINLYYILYFQWVVFSVGVLPIALFITLHYAWLMKHRAEKALTITAHLKRSHQAPQDKSESKISLKASNKKDALYCSLSQLIMIAAAENYVEVHTHEDGLLQKVLIRNTLTNIEKQLSHYQNFLRCHKSYIVNKEFVQQVSGNAAGYKLHLRVGDYEIPVSRSLNATINTLL